MRIMRWSLWAAILTVATGCSLGPEWNADFFVSPCGNDDWSGTLPEPNRAGNDGPFASLARARDAVRESRSQETRPSEVIVRAGTYFLAEPLHFGPADTGSAEAPIRYVAAEGERPILSGGQRITGWKETKVNDHAVWVAELPEVKQGKWYFRQLFVNGERRFRPRVPDKGFYRFTGYPGFDPKAQYRPGQSQAFFEAGHLQDWHNPKDVEVVIFHYWVAPRMAITKIDESQNLVSFTQPTMRKLTDSFNTKQFARYYADNVFEALDAPGEWYLDRASGNLYYIPLPGETIPDIQVTAPRLKYLLHIEGDHEAVRHLSIEGLAFQHAEDIDSAKNHSDKQASSDLGAAVTFENAEKCSLTDCSIQHVSGYGIEILKNCEEVAVRRCRLSDLGAGGIKVWHESNHSTITDNEISNGGCYYHNAVGVLIGKSNQNLVAHNSIHHFYYTGVSVGWSWGYQKSSAAGNIIEFNHIHHIGQGLLSDMAGVYTLGISPGTIVRNNLIHDIEADNYGGWGLYCDEGSSDIVMENNVVFRTTHGGFHQHYGKANIIRNNILAFGKHAQIMRTREEEHLSFTFERNIVIFSSETLLGGNWNNDRFMMDQNVYWRVDGQPFEFKGASLDAWRKRGHDMHSIIADPLFLSPADDDYRLKPESPAIKRLNFQPIDVTGVWVHDLRTEKAVQQ